MRVVFWIALSLVYLPAKLFFPVKTIGRENIPKEKKGLLLVSNHLTWKDILVIIFAIPGFRYIVSKKENGKNPIARFFLKLFGVVFIDRDNIEVSSMRNLVKLLKDGKNMVIFPEGKRNKENCELQPIKSGAALIALQSGATIMPTMIANRTKIFRKTYLCIAPVFKLSEAIERPYNSQKINDATVLLESKMREGLERAQAYREEKLRKNKENKK